MEFEKGFLKMDSWMDWEGQFQIMEIFTMGILKMTKEKELVVFIRKISINGFMENLMEMIMY